MFPFSAEKLTHTAQRKTTLKPYVKPQPTLIPILINIYSFNYFYLFTLKLKIRREQKFKLKLLNNPLPRRPIQKQTEHLIVFFSLAELSRLLPQRSCNLFSRHHHRKLRLVTPVVMVPFFGHGSRRARICHWRLSKLLLGFAPPPWNGGVLPHRLALTPSLS